MTKYKYHHLGIPTEKSLKGEEYLKDYKVYHCGYEHSEYGIEWMRYEDDCSLPEIVKTIPHIAFEVDDIYAAIKGKKVLIEPNSPSAGTMVAFIEENGAPIEFIQTAKKMISNNTLLKYFFIIAGILCVTLGVMGIFLPLLPATPFFLLAAACFFRSSEPLYAWIINHKFFGKKIQYYRAYKAISLRSKLLSLVLLWLTIGYSAFFVVKTIWIKIVLFLIAIGVSVHLISFRTLTQKMIEDIERENKKN